MLTAFGFPDLGSTPISKVTTFPAEIVTLAQCSEVKENIVSAIVRPNESKTFVPVEHLDFALRHAASFQLESLLPALGGRQSDCGSPDALEIFHIRWYIKE
jgi:hypothetical protein